MTTAIHVAAATTRATKLVRTAPMTLSWAEASLGEATPPDRAARGERVALDCPTDGIVVTRLVSATILAN